MKSIAIMAHPEVAVFELGCATELFALPRPEMADWYQSEVVSLTPGPFRLVGDMELDCKTVKNLRGFQTLVVPSWPVYKSDIPDIVATSINEFAEAGGRILSFCSGAFLLGHLGLLDGQEATTHWRYQQQFQNQFPDSVYKPNVLYTLTNKLGCSAGSSAAIDLGLAVIREDFGSEIANNVARRLVLSGHRKGGQAQFIETPVPMRPNRLAEAMEWATQNLAKHLSVSAMAEIAAISRRSFDRQFRKQLGQSPQAWIIEQRLSLASQLLETTNNTIEEIADQTGFSTAGNLRHHFQKNLGLSPRQYRDNFCH